MSAQRFRKILFVTSNGAGQKGALVRAIELAKVNKSRLTLIDALDFEDQLSLELDSATRSAIEGIQDKLLKERTAELNRLRKSFLDKHPGLRVSVEVHAEKPALAIIRSVLRNNHDLVMKVPEGARSTFEGLFGTTDLKLMRKCPCPVWIDKPSRKRRYRKILAAVDVNPVIRETQLLARRIMEIASSLAIMEKSELHVVHAWNLAGEARLRGRQVTTHAVDKLVREIRTAHQTELNMLLQEFPDRKRTVHFLRGKAGEVIPPLVGKLEADLVIIGTVGRTGIPGFFIGNTAEKVLNAVDCSVLTLKPDGFKTPIEV